MKSRGAILVMGMWRRSGFGRQDSILCLRMERRLVAVKMGMESFWQMVYALGSWAVYISI